MISINATLVVQIINFLVLIWILNRILFKPILRIIEERETVLEDSRTEMKRLKVEAEEKAHSLDVQMRQARKEAAARRDDARDQANSQALEIMNQAQDEAKEHMEAVRVEAETEAAKAKENLVNFKDAVIEMLFLKVMGRKV
jgi:F-type H+-transporting ATPase subunit b